MDTQQFNVTTVLEKIRQQKKINQRKAYAQSRLNRYRAELVALRKAGASYRELTLWLRKDKRIKMNHVSVMRYLIKLPELKDDPNA
jgi:hypothetical protein